MPYTQLVFSLSFTLPALLLLQTPAAAVSPPDTPPAPLSVKFSPVAPPNLKVRGARAPKSLRLYKGIDGFTFTVTGPARISLRLHALTLKRGGPESYPVRVRIDDRKAKLVPIPGQGKRAWTLPDHRLLGLALPKTLTVAVTAGKHRIRVKPAADIMLGIAVRIRARQLKTETIEKTLVAEEDPNEPPLVGPGGEIDMLDEAAEKKDVAATTEKNSDPAEEPIIPPEPRVVDIEGARLFDPPKAIDIGGSPQEPVESYYTATADTPLLMEVEGPRQLELRVRAFRVVTAQESLNNQNLTVLLDDVLARSIELSAPADPSVHLTGIDAVPSRIEATTVDVPPGTHRIALVASDNAVAGIAVAFGAAPAVEIMIPTAQPMVVEAGERLEPTVYAGIMAPFGLQGAGYALWVQTQLSLSGLHSRLHAAIELGVLGTQYNLKYADPRTASGSAILSSGSLTFPLALSGSYRIDVHPLKLDIGAGGGVLVQSLNLDASGVRSKSSSTSVFGMLHANLAMPLGPGAAVVRVIAMASPTYDTAEFIGRTGAGILVMAGYRLALDF